MLRAKSPISINRRQWSTVSSWKRGEDDEKTVFVRWSDTKLLEGTEAGNDGRRWKKKGVFVRYCGIKILRGQTVACNVSRFHNGGSIDKMETLIKLLSLYLASFVGEQLVFTLWIVSGPTPRNRWAWRDNALTKCSYIRRGGPGNRTLIVLRGGYLYLGIPRSRS